MGNAAQKNSWKKTNALITPGPNNALERTGHTTGFFQGWAAVGCGPPLTASVRLLTYGL